MLYFIVFSKKILPLLLQSTEFLIIGIHLSIQGFTHGLGIADLIHDLPLLRHIIVITLHGFKPDGRYTVILLDLDLIELINHLQTFIIGGICSLDLIGDQGIDLRNLFLIRLDGFLQGIPILHLRNVTLSLIDSLRNTLILRLDAGFLGSDLLLVFIHRLSRQVTQKILEILVTLGYILIRYIASHTEKHSPLSIGMLGSEICGRGDELECFLRTYGSDFLIPFLQVAWNIVIEPFFLITLETLLSLTLRLHPFLGESATEVDFLTIQDEDCRYLMRDLRDDLSL